MRPPPSSAAAIPLPRTSSPYLTSGTYSYSLMPKKSHSKAIIAVIEAPLRFEIVAHIASCVRNVVPDIAVHDDVYAFKPCATHASHPPCCPTLESFIASTVWRSGVQNPTLLGMLVLLRRLKAVLPIGIHMQSYCTLHRLFITALILASKSLNDRSPSNDLWSKFSGSVFTAAELLCMEREMLCRLDYSISLRDEVAVLSSARDLSIALGIDMPENEVQQASSEVEKESDLEVIQTGHSRDATVTPESVAASVPSVQAKPVLLDESDEAITFSIPATPQLVRSDSSRRSSSSSALESSGSSGRRSGSSSIWTRRSLSSSMSAPDLTSLRRPLFSRPNFSIEVKCQPTPGTVAIEQGEADEVESHSGYRLITSHNTIDTSCSEQIDKAHTATIIPNASLSCSSLLPLSPTSSSASSSTSSQPSSSDPSPSGSPVSPALISTYFSMRVDTGRKMCQQLESMRSSALYPSAAPMRLSTPGLEQTATPPTRTSSSNSPLSRPIPLMSLMDQVLHRRRNRQRRAKDESRHHPRSSNITIHL